ncbi:MAG TPA: ATP-binding protein, partial [Polyangia bacterium]|nr:ATP-binding protein [Polyangia bacterium]
MGRDLERENQILRERVAQLETAAASGVDPILRSLSEHAAAFINVITPDGHFLATVRSSEAFGSVVGRSLFDFVDEASAQVMRAVYARVAETGRPEVYESVGYGEDGSPGHTYLTRCVPLIEDNRVRALLLVPTDITHRVHLERSLIEKEEALRFAIQASRLGLWSWDIASGAITWNDRLRAIWRTERTPDSFQSYLEHVHPDDRAMVEGLITEALASGNYPTFEHRGLAFDDGQEIWILAAGTVVKDAAGRPIRITGGAMDITEQKQLAVQRQRAARVEGIGQLAAGIAHNFNNLLAVVIPNIELELSANPAAGSAGLTAALDAALQARDLVRNLLLLTQRDPSHPPTPSDPLDVVARVVGICRVTFPREIALRHQVATPLGFVSMPVADLEQVLLNLLLNARDAVEAALTDPREIAIEVRVIVTDAGAPMVQLRVKDSGIGMSQDVRARLFEPFFTTKPPHKGSGLGLANVAERVRSAGGTVQCESAPGKGTTFTILLPVVSAPRPTPRPAA